MRRPAESQQAGRAQQFLDRFVSPIASRLLWKLQLAQEEFPGVIGLEVTSICNLRCPMCARTFSNRKFGHMPVSAVRDLIDQIAPYDARGLVEQVALQEYGEIFLHPDWFEIIEHACERIRRAHLRLDTNGTMMTPEVTDRLFESRLQSLIVSVDGVDDQSYNVLRQGGKFSQLVDNLTYFLERRRREPDRGPAVSIQVIESAYTRAYLPSFVEAWRGRIRDAQRVGINVIPYHDFAGGINDARFATRRRSGLHVNLPCYRLTYEMDVYSDGVVSVCCLDSERTIEIGNATTQPLAEIWRGSRAQQFRDDMRRADYARLALCRTCPHSQKFMANYFDRRRLVRAWSVLSTAARRARSRRLMR